MVAVIHTKVFFYKNIGNCNKAYKRLTIGVELKTFSIAVEQTYVI